MRRVVPRPLLILTPYLAVTGLIGLFLWSGIEGDRGLDRLATAEADVLRLDRELETLRARRSIAENRVRRLKREFLDLDLLDERARTVLGLARPDEIVIAPVNR